MLRLGTLRWKGRCPRHQRYDPRSEGEGGVVGGCTRCLKLLEIYEHHRELQRLMREFGPVRERAGTKEKPAGARQPSLFE